MEAKMTQFFESVGNFFTGGDQIPWCERDIIAGCEREVAEAQKGSNDEFFKECLMRLSWSLVHSRQPEDVIRGIAMLGASLSDANSNPLQLRETVYLLAVGHYRNGDYSKSMELVEQCLTIQPAWRQALNLKKMNEDRIKRDGAIGIGIAATAVGLIAGGIAAAVARKN
ncbi:mitochondrial fission 1 protein A-like [Argentina anserina]|uniref:mitochondrial fission 1 protein A-like n=1 Tax=Argentina anserina TaxID=57926 RepID=UPI00217646BB|nr:mitochondrial fission 1 protein A-like [Potentilla anserina]